MKRFAAALALLIFMVFEDPKPTATRPKKKPQHPKLKLNFVRYGNNNGHQNVTIGED